MVCGNKLGWNMCRDMRYMCTFQKPMLLCSHTKVSLRCVHVLNSRLVCVCTYWYVQVPKKTKIVCFCTSFENVHAEAPSCEGLYNRTQFSVYYLSKESIIPIIVWLCFNYKQIHNPGLRKIEGLACMYCTYLIYRLKKTQPLASSLKCTVGMYHCSHLLKYREYARTTTDPVQRPRLKAI